MMKTMEERKKYLEVWSLMKSLQEEKVRERNDKCKIGVSINKKDWMRMRIALRKEKARKWKKVKENTYRCDYLQNHWTKKKLGFIYIHTSNDVETPFKVTKLSTTLSVAHLKQIGCGREQNDKLNSK